MAITPPVPDGENAQATNARQKYYWVGGAPPYGYTQTQPYNAAWAPDLPKIPGDSQAEVALYERLDWDQGGPTALAQQYQNPPFIGVGQSTGRIPGWMMTKDGKTVKRILRGYIRRMQSWDLSIPNLTDEQKAESARLFFMYNPSDIQRQYLSYDDMSGIRSADPNAAGNAGVPAFNIVMVNLELFFDRQAEVAAFPDHPGVLVDLAVFDLLIGQKPMTLADIAANTQMIKNALGTDQATEGGQAAVADSMATLTNDTSIRLAFIMSPNLMFQGVIQEASALFQKFSHRMTPTRMTLSLTLRITYVGQKMDAVTLNASDYATFNARTSAAKTVAEVDPTKTAASADAAAQLNYNGRVGMVDWASSWTAEAKKHYNPVAIPEHKVPAQSYGVYYSGDLRCTNSVHDDYILREDAAHSPDNQDHTPGWLDCSGLVYRAIRVIGWAKALGLPADCTGPGSTNSEGIWSAADSHHDVWKMNRIGVVADHTVTESPMSADSFNKWTVPSNAPATGPDGKPAHGPNTGDILIKGGHGSGNGSAGHVAFMSDFISSDPDASKWQWKILHSHATGKPVEYETFTTDALKKEFDWILRAGPIKSS